MHVQVKQAVLSEVRAPCYAAVTPSWFDGQRGAVRHGADDKRFSRCANIICLLPTEKAIVCVLTQSAKEGTRVGFLFPRQGVFHLQGKCP